jgi:hypothetical protein
MEKFNIIIDDSWNGIDMSVNKNIGSDVTLLTIGDSWVWGDELGHANGVVTEYNKIICSDTEYRTSRVFGNLLSQQLASNWVQMALPGGSSEWIITEFEKLATELAKLTNKLIVVICLSDHGRELGTTLDRNEIYRKGFSANLSIMDIITQIEQSFYNRINKILAKNINIFCIANSTFTTPLIKQQIQTEKTWLEVISPGQTVPDIYIHGSGASNIDKFLSMNGLLTEEYKQDFIDLIWKPFSVHCDFLKNHKLLHTRAHPTELGHKMWADYLEKYIRNKKWI